jgi:hypothetical protein
MITINKKPSVLNHLKKIKNSQLRVIELGNIIKKKELNNFEFESTQLKAILFLFPKLDRFNAFKYLVKHFDIKLSELSEPEIKVLTACLSQDPTFNNLLPFDKKIFGGFFPAKQNVKKVTPYTTPKITGNGIYNSCKINTNPRQSSNPSQAKATNRNLRLAQLRLSFIKELPEFRLNFFRRSEIKDGYQALIASMDLEAFKNFIEIFPPNDVIKFLNFPMIRNQIEGFKRQNSQLTEESYKDLLRYFIENNQKEAVKKLLRPIVSPDINTKLTKQGIFKAINEKVEYVKSLPDIVASHKMSRTG